MLLTNTFSIKQFRLLVGMLPFIFFSCALYGQDVFDKETCANYRQEYIKLGTNPTSSEDKRSARALYINIGKCMDRGYLEDPQKDQKVKEVILSE